ncbi:MAG: YciI family protein [Actinomycetaceae bacterium]|nr:YciI family protein [Actinomycetaceae bacterium]MDU0970906.1 YciI family protein [Actinomycetaceae bacterium]
MFVVAITITNPGEGNDADQRLSAHRAWFTRHFDEGDFILVGPRTDREAAGVLVADLPDRPTLDRVLSEDAFWPDRATYEVAEFDAKLRR